MADINTGNPFYDMIMADYVGAKETQANRPIQTSQTSKPLEYNDMLKRRNQIGAERAALANALKQRENFGYGFANALANMPAQQGYGSWLGDFARGFGLAYNARTNSEISRAEQDYENAQKDLADALMYNKAMGEEQIMGYTPFATGTKGQTTSTSKTENDRRQQLIRQEVAGTSLADVYKTINNNQLVFSELAPIYQDSASRALKSGVKQLGIQGLGRAELQYLQSIMPKGFSSAINTAREQELLRPLTTAFEEGAGTAKTAAIVNYYGSLYDEYESMAAAQGFRMPIDKQTYINSRLTQGRELNPAYYTGDSKDMYKVESTANKNQNIREGGYVVNGFRFKGGDVHDKNNWEQVK